MKPLRCILCIALILAAIGLVLYQGLVKKDPETNDLVKCVLVIIGSISTMFKKRKMNSTV